jgi:CDP-diacylglycerol--glycerol-3-phosphate 3-phosphatidyltransferase
MFGALTFYAFSSDQRVLGVAALICLVTGQVISYVKARADSVNLKIGGALAERAERNVLGLVGAGLAGLGVPHALDVCLWILAAAGLLTVVQRLVQVRRAAVKAAADTGQNRGTGRPAL